MAGISSRTASFGNPQNKKGYNGNEIQNKEFSDGSGLEQYDFNARTYDQQIGRFMQIDPMSDEEHQESWTPYHFTFNNPILYNDPDGRHPPLVWGYRLLRVIYEIEKMSQKAVGNFAITTRNTADNARNVMILPQTKLDEIQRVVQKRAEGIKQKLGEEVEKLKGETNSLQRAQRSLEKNVKEHEEKLKDYQNNPDKYDNLGKLKDVNPEIREKIINGRIKELKNQIQKNKGELEKTNKQLEQKQKELEQKNSLLKQL